MNYKAVKVANYGTRIRKDWLCIKIVEMIWGL